MENTYTILAVVVLGLCLELIIAYKLRSDKKRFEKLDRKYKAEFEHIKEQLDKVVAATRNESQEIVSKTLDQYNDIHSEVAEFTKQLHQRIDDITEEIVEQEKDLLTEHTQKASKELISATRNEIETLSKVVQQSVLEIQQKISTEFILESQAAHREIDTFKKDQIAKIAKESEQLVNKVAKKYFGKYLANPEKHELTLQLIDEIWQEEAAKNVKN